MPGVKPEAATRQASWPPANGFSLVELLVTIALFGLLTTLSLPTFVGWIKNTQVRTVAESLQNGLRVAQTEALRRSTQVVFYRTNAALTAANTSASPPTLPFATGGVNWVVLTVPQFNAAASVDFVQGGALGSTASATSLSGPDALCFDANGRVVVIAPANLPTGVTCVAANAPPAPAATFAASQPAPADRELRVQVSSGGKVRMCDPKRTLSATAPDGC